MPIFKVTATEEAKRKLVAYVEAPNSDVADAWASMAPDHAFREVGDVAHPWGEVQTIEPVAGAPEGWCVGIAT